MHIGIVTACYEPVVNGVTQMVALYEKYLVSAGHQVTVFTLGEPTPGEDRNRVVRSPGISLGETGYHLAAAYSSEAKRRLQNVDIIHCHHILMGLEFAKRYGNGPVVFTNHTRYDLYLNSYGRVPNLLASQLMSKAWQKLTKYADVVVAPSASVARVLLEAGVGVPIEVIENGVEVEHFRRPVNKLDRADFGIPSDGVVFTYVGRLSREKNIRRLVEEFRLVAAGNKDATLLLVGGGPLQSETERLVAVQGLTERVRLLGLVAPEVVPDLLAISDVFVSASVTEVHPLSVIEALAVGLPVVAVDSPGMMDIVERDWSGLLVDGTKGSLARAMSAVAQDAHYRRRLAAGAKQAGTQYEIQNNVKRTLSLYRRLIDGQYEPACSSVSTSHAGSRIRKSGSRARYPNLVFDHAKRRVFDREW